MIGEKIFIAGWTGISSLFGIGYAEFHQEIDHLANQATGQAALVIEETVYANETGRWLAEKFNQATTAPQSPYATPESDWFSALSDVIKIPDALGDVDLGTAFTQSFNTPNSPLNLPQTTPNTPQNHPPNPWEDSVEALNAVSEALERAAR